MPGNNPFHVSKVQSPVIKAGQAVEKKYSAMPVPTLYIHGWNGNERSTDQLIESAEDEKGAKKVLKVKVSRKEQRLIRESGIQTSNIL